ncbi:MAG: GIY-YIG nuclease family protein [Pyramidobacter sp.]|jgi:putative endonuclease
MKGFFSYILECADGTLYSGFTTDPEKRLAQHNAGCGARYTRTRRPLRVAALWQWPDKGAALSAEWHVKKLPRQHKDELILRPQEILQICKAAPLRTFTPEQMAEINSSAKKHADQGTQGGQTAQGTQNREDQKTVADFVALGCHRTLKEEIK